MSSCFGPCKKKYFDFDPKVLILVLTVSLPPLREDVDNGELSHPSHLAA